MLARSQVILVDTLKELGGIDEMQADGLKERSGLSGSDVEKILTGDYNVEPVPMLLAKAKAYNLAPINLQRFNVTDQCFEYLEVEFCKSLNILPLGEVGSYIAIATSDPLNPTLRSKIEGATRKPFYFLLALESELQAKYDTGEKTHINPTVGFSDVVEALGLEFDLDAEKIEEKDFESEESAPVILLANRIIEDAYFSGGSDIHIEPFEDDTRVRVRVDGICKVKLTLPKKTTAALISRIKVMANLDIAERRVSQDGRISFRQYNRKGIDGDLRISTSPMNYGEGCVMRLLDKQKSTLPLEALGFSQENIRNYRELIDRPYGMVLHCGPTGSGKSMTLYSALNEINSPEHCIRTAEDPIEYTLPGICQVQMNRKIGLSFANSLRSFLRQDPDILLVGEIRDKETASIAVEAALTGHLLFSTLHTNDAPMTVIRLQEMGVEPFLISSCLLCVCAQRLVRRLCETCKIAHDPEGRESELLEKAISWNGPIFAQKPKGCPNCGGTGYRGRIGVHELMPTSEDLVHGINMGYEAAQLRAIAIRNGMTTLHQDGMLKVKQGITSFEECAAVVPPDLKVAGILQLQDEMKIQEA